MICTFRTDSLLWFSGNLEEIIILPGLRDWLIPMNDCSIIDEIWIIEAMFIGIILI